MLEREQQYRLAAELADAADLKAELRVRLWALAGELERAVRLARRHDAFAEAIAGLKGHAEVATTLRQLWAMRWAETGHHIKAIEILWPDVRRPLAEAPFVPLRDRGVDTTTVIRAWMAEALRLGGIAAIQVFVRQLALTPGAFESIRARAEAIQSDDGVDGRPARELLADAYNAAPRIEGVSALARPLVRQLMLDGPAHPHDQLRISTLAQTARDPVLQADLPPIRLASGRPDSVNVDFSPFERGQVAIHDAVRLPSGRFLLALGEAGILFITADGRPLTHLKVAATRLVASDTGHRALALIRRGQLTQIHRVDLVRWRATLWCEQSLGAYASTFDGWRWVAAIGAGRRTSLVDVTDKTPRIEDHLAAEDPFRITRWGDSLSQLIATPEKTLFIEHYDLTQVRLVRRDPVEFPGVQPSNRLHVGDLTGDGTLTLFRLVTLSVADDEGGATPRAEWRIQSFPGGREDSLAVPPTARYITSKQVDDHTLMVFGEDGGVTVNGFERDHRTPWLKLRLEGSTTAGIRLGDRLALVCDDVGRLILLDLNRRAVASRLTIRL